MAEYNFDQPQPAFTVTALPVPVREAEVTTNYMCSNLYNIDFGRMRTVLASPKRRIKGMSNFGGPHVKMAVQLLREPFDLGIHVFSFGKAVSVRLRPEDFDLSDAQQEKVYAQCVGLLEVLCEIPVSTDEPMVLAIGKLKFNSTQADADKQAWQDLLRRWTAKR